MARVTVEDCAEHIPNRFELVALASQRAKDISSGSPITIERDHDKDPVVSLREIALGNVTPDKLKEILIQNCQEKVRLDEYGVESSTVDAEKTEKEEVSSEVLQEMQSLQEDPDEDGDELLYGEDNLEVED